MLSDLPSWASLLVYAVIFFLLWVTLMIVRLVYTIAYSQSVSSPLFTYTKDSPIDVHLNNVYYPVSYHTERGGRAYQEDRYHALAGRNAAGDSSLFAIYDGHGGSKAAQYCRDYLLDYILSADCFETDTYKALEGAFDRLNSEFCALARRHDLSDGSTAVVGVVNNRKISIANVGDSRGIVVDRSGRVSLATSDHCPNRADEELRIRSLGGRIIHWGRWRVQGVLAVSRAIGDVALHPYITGSPEIIERELDEDDCFLVLASDGLWDVLKNEEVGKFVMHYKDLKFANVARDLCFEAIILGSTDNVTVQVVDLRRPAGDHSKRQLTTTHVAALPAAPAVGISQYVSS